MTKTGEILDAINAILVKAFPKRPVYVNFCPDDFKRPCFLIEFISSTQIAASYYTNEITVYFTITCYEEVDEYSISSQTDLIRIQGEVLEAFSRGVLQVGDRHLELMTSAGGCDASCSFVDLQLSYFDDKLRKESQEERMEEIKLTINEKG